MAASKNDGDKPAVIVPGEVETTETRVGAKDETAGGKAAVQRPACQQPAAAADPNNVKVRLNHYCHHAFGGAQRSGICI